MNTRHPLARLSPAGQRSLFLAFLLLTLATSVALRTLDAPLQTAVAPAGIVSFEFAGDLQTALHILASWHPQAEAYAGLSLGLDYLFMVAYSTAIALGCVMLAGAWRAQSPIVTRMGLLLAWGQWLAAGFDAVENVALIRLLLGDHATLWPPLAQWCATFKFGLILVGLLYVFIGGLTLFLLRRRRG